MARVLAVLKLNVSGSGRLGCVAADSSDAGRSFVLKAPERFARSLMGTRPRHLIRSIRDVRQRKRERVYEQRRHETVKWARIGAVAAVVTIPLSVLLALTAGGGDGEADRVERGPAKLRATLDVRSGSTSAEADGNGVLRYTEATQPTIFVNLRNDGETGTTVDRGSNSLSLTRPRSGCATHGAAVRTSSLGRWVYRFRVERRKAPSSRPMIRWPIASRPTTLADLLWHSSRVGIF